MHEFGTDPITSHPYTVTPDVLDTDLSNSEWTNNLGIWVSYLGESGQAIGHASALAGATVTLNFDIAPGKELEIASFNFWRKRSPVGAQSWAMTINGIDVGNGSIPSTGAEIGTTAVANPVNGLTGNVTIVITLSNAIGSGWFALDNFTLNGTLTDACIPPTVTSVSPQSGPAQTVVTIEGSGFEAGTGTTSVLFNGVESNGFTVISDTTIRAVVPVDATDGDITIITDGCEANAGTFTVFESDCPDSGSIPDLFISELYDHTPGSYGVIELYNPTPNTITFNDEYVLERYGDIGGATASYSLVLPGSVAPFTTYLVRSYGTGVLGCTVATDAEVGTGINDNDEFKLKKNGVLIDVAHAPTNTGYTVIRNADATAPSPTFISGDWSFTSNDCSDLGTHNITLAAAIATQPESTSVCENNSAQFSVSVTDDTGFTYQWKTLNDSGNWVNLTDDATYSGTNTNTLTVTQVTNSMDGQQFYCEIESVSCTLVTDGVQLTVSPLPLAIVIPTQPTCTTNTGSIEITASIGDDLTYSLDGVNFQTETTFTGLAPGNYTLYIESSTGCSSTMPVEIEEAPDGPAIATTVQTQPTCTTNTGSIEVTAPLDATLEYSLNGIDFQSGTTFDNLAPSTYTITVQNDEGCISVTEQITIDDVPTPPAVATLNISQSTCTTPETVEVTAPLGADLEYSIDGINFQSETTFTGIAAGNYTITVRNNDGCTSETASFTIDEAPTTPVVATTTVIQPTCNTNANIEVTAPLGTDLEYSIDGVNFQTETTFTGLSAGNYTVTVRNNDGCTSVTGTITINPSVDAPDTPTVSVTQPDCTTAIGSIEVTAPLGADLEYSIDGTNFQSGTTFNNLAAGSYTVTVKNSADCTSTTNIVINDAPETPAIATVTETQPDCTTATGSIEVTAPLGADLEYSIDGTNFQSGTTFNNLAAGTYTVTVQNNDGCTSVTADIVINDAPETPAVATITETQPDCTTSTGSIEVTAPLGADLEYSIDGTNFQSATTFDNLAAGTYTVTVQNNDGCTSVTADIVINSVTTPDVATTTVTQPDCTTPTGSIDVTAPLGADLEYSIDGTNFQPGTTFNNLAAGTYTVIVRNNDGCTSETATITIDADNGAPDVATITETQPDCTTATGSIEVTAPLGADLEYSIDGTNFQSATIFDNLTPGTYNVTVRNGAGCISTTTDIVINTVTTPTAPTATATQATCNVNASIEVTAPLGADLEYSIDGATFQSDVTFNDVAAGTYTVTVRNNDGCTATSSNIIIDDSPQAEIATYLETQPTCAVETGTIEVVAPVGAGYSYSIDGTNFQSSRFFSNLQPGQYTITLENPDGCTSVTEAITINDVPTPPTITGVQGCSEITGGEVNYLLNFKVADNSFDINTATITWINENGSTIGNDITFNVTEYADMNSIEGSDYPLEITAIVETAGGCETSYTFIIDGILCTIPRGISPNNDNQNDNFDLSGLNAQKVIIFNRYGKEVYSKTNYTNEWNGQTDNGDELPTGTYFYVVETTSGSKTGWVYVNRQEN
ncbi:hypothetical protein GCM10007424_03800 [Flavobacterium suaedae]|uniref:T9SS type B sorting domain-containing protein n=2 Tax=Flavobacterium suaedae TaxID=1767027 RepID=A0ABQ1JFG3_9FLAO|nr:hypothetical protein GCM10007424_03800 [Flavobacterium suaedae]